MTAENKRLHFSLFKEIAKTQTSNRYLSKVKHPRVTKLNLSKCTILTKRREPRWWGQYRKVFLAWSSTLCSAEHLWRWFIWVLIWFGSACVYVCVLYLQAGDVSLRPASQLHTRDRSFNPEAPQTQTHTCNTHWLTDSYTQRHTCIREHSITSNTGQIALLFTKTEVALGKG